MLARLANETGGRLTAGTNDLTLGYARARRDLGCHYTVGVYLPDEPRDRPRRVTLHVRGDGLRVLHPERHAIRSREERKVSSVTAAFTVPEMFENSRLRAHVFTLQPRSKDEWDTLIAVNFPVGTERVEETVEVEFAAVVYQGSRVWHAFNRTVTLRPRPGGETGPRELTFLEPATLAPGSYEIRVVMLDARDGAEVGATRLAVEIPPIRKGDLMLVTPILGRPREKNIVLRGDGAPAPAHGAEPITHRDIVAAEGSFEPLLVLQTEAEERLGARNKACLVGARPALLPPADATFDRAVLRDGDEAAATRLPEVALALDDGGKVLCQNLFEVLPDDAADPGSYSFEATIDVPRGKGGRQGPLGESLRFAVEERAP